MSEIDQLKMEARQLLEEVNDQFERSTGNRNSGTFYNFESLCESSFKNRLKQLKKKGSITTINSCVSGSPGVANCKN